MQALARTVDVQFTYGMDLPTKLSQLMEARRVSQADVARAAGMAQTAISRVLGGKQRLYLDQAAQIADYLGVSVDYLADDSLDEPPRGPELSEDERVILRMARVLGAEKAIRRLVDPPILGTNRQMGLTTDPGDPDD
jgi:transcriptional regulator with XRE-family HTH domain